MIWTTLKTAKGKKFLLCLLGVFVIAASIVTRATIGGVIGGMIVIIRIINTVMEIIKLIMGIFGHSVQKCE